MAATAVALSSGAIQALKEQDSYSQPVVFKVKSVAPKDESRFRITLSDGNQDIQGVLATQLSPIVRDGKIRPSGIVRVTAYTVTPTPSGVFLVVTELEVLSEGSTEGPTPMDATPAAKTPHLKSGGPAIKAEPLQPSPMFTPNIVKQQPQDLSSQQGPTPPSAAPPSISKRTSGFCHIKDLHPYDDQWKLRAKLARKYPLRSTKGSGHSILTVELVDDEGTQIQGTFWRAQADRWAAALEEGKVYVFEKFQVKPANKQFSSVRNDYEVSFNDKSDVSESADQQVAAAMNAAVEHVPLDQLLKHITRKAPVDVLAVVVAIGPSGTVKRKSDQAEIQRRDITLADRSGKSVVLTLWGDNALQKAPELEGREGSVVVECTACKVSEFNGCSLSSLNRSQLTIEPNLAAARDLLSWWQSEGQATTLVPVGGEAATRASGGGAGSTRMQLHTCQDVTTQTVPEPDAKPVYHNLLVTVMGINQQRELYYLANPQTGKKVVEREGRYYCESDGTWCDVANNRYMMSVKVMDMTGDLWVNCFNEQAEAVLGLSADELHAIKQQDEAAYTARVKAAQWQELSFSVQTKTREYQGERKMRHGMMSAKPMSFAAEAQRLLTLIERY